MSVRNISAREASQGDADEVIKALQTDIHSGLTNAQVQIRRNINGFNEFNVKEDTPLWKKYIEQFQNPLILLLLGSALISLIIQQYDDCASIGLAVIIVVTVGFVQEYRSEQSLAALGKLVPPRCNCVRNGKTENILARELVPGDVIILLTGDRVPADIRLIESVDLTIDESSFTGEAEPVFKTCSVENVNNRRNSETTYGNFIYMGTLVRNGHAKGIVTATGEGTEFGEMYRMMSEVDAPKTPLQNSMDTLGKQLSLYSLAVIALIGFVGFVRGTPLMETFTIAVSLAVAAIPEGLPIVVTVTLALGVFRMAKRNAIVRRLPAVETLGCVSVLCSDKTGTLTKNEMTVTKLACFDDNSNVVSVDVSGVGYQIHGGLSINGRFIRQRTFSTSTTPPDIGNMSSPSSSDEETNSVCNMLEAGWLCCNAIVIDGLVHGPPTEGALIVAAMKAGLSDPRGTAYYRLYEWPFSHESKFMAVRLAHRSYRDVSRFVIKGAAEMILPRCQLHGDALRLAQRAESKLATDGLRVIAVAELVVNNASPISSGQKTERPELPSTGFRLLGLYGMMDPPRENSKETLNRLAKMKIRCVMITGDSRETARSIALQLNMNVDRMTSGGELDRLMHSQSDNGVNTARVSSSDCVIDFERSKQRRAQEVARNTDIFYRVGPKHKLSIVRALREGGEVVAMSGDGVNDSVALRAADIGIAMGRTGTDVSREAADMILVDDDLSSVCDAVDEGKSIFANIRNFVRFQLSTSIAALSLIAVSNLCSWPSPLNPMQILWINIIMDGPPAQSLGVEPVDEEITQRPPRRKTDNIITRGLLSSIIVNAMTILTGTLFVYLREMTADGKVTPRDTTMTFTCFVLFDMCNAYACRSQLKSLLHMNPFGNRAFVITVGGSLLAQLLVIYTPIFQWIFQTEALSLGDIVYLVCVSSSLLMTSEMVKYCRRNHKLRRFFSDDNLKFDSAVTKPLKFLGV